jgi:hypothetical protein
MQYYNVCGIDGVSISFSKDELTFCTYAREMYTNTSGVWIESDDPLLVPMMNSTELQLFQQFLQIRLRIGEPPCIRDTPPYVSLTEIRYKGIRGTGYNVVIWPSLINVRMMREWNEEYTGIKTEYIQFLETLVTHMGESARFQWIDYADYLGCNDLCYLLTANIAYLYKKYIYAYLDNCKSVRGKAENEKDRIHQYLHRTDPHIQYTDSEREFLKNICECNEKNPLRFQMILRKFVNHRGLPMPRPEWTDEQWDVFMEQLPAFYASLPLSVTDRAKLRHIE